MGKLARMHKDKPQAPTWEQITEEERLYRALDALGVDDAKAAQTSDDAVFDAIVEIFKETGRPPSDLTQIHDRAKLAIKPQSIKSVLNRLKSDGRVLSPSRGIYVPVLDEARG